MTAPDLQWDVPEGADGPQFHLAIEYDETRLRFYIADQNSGEGEAVEWREVGSWREASLGLARQLRVLSSPIALGGIVLDGEGGGEFGPGRRAPPPGTLTDEETLSLLGVSEGWAEDYDPGER